VNNGKICVSVCAKTTDEMIAKIRRAEEFADVIEVRFDCLSKREFSMQMEAAPLVRVWANILGSTRKPVISTYRAQKEGGHQFLDNDERRGFWYGGMETEYCDVEEDLYGDASTQLFGRRIISHHDLAGNSSTLDEVFDRLASIARVDVVKVASRGDDITDSIPVWRLLERGKAIGKPVIPIAMGQAGKWTRVLGLAYGGYLTYGSLDEGEETAPGQITARDLVEMYRVKELDLETKVFGVVGDPVSESVSTYMHNPAFASAGVNAVFIPLMVKDLDEFIRRMVRLETREVELNFGGFSVTMPHKQTILKHLDMIDPMAKEIGAVNTVKIEGDKLTGYNTDAHGFITPLKEKFGDLTEARVAVVGAGGAARACVFALKQENALVTVVARDKKKAEQFADEFDIDWTTLSNIKDQRSKIVDDFDIVVDTSPLGMKGPLENEALFTADELKGVKFVYDIVTRPVDTPLIREAKEAGVPAIGGLEMVVAQGAKQFEIWTGMTPPVSTMKEAVTKRMERIRR
jgi:3-dehydroquinate dehydratase/shikimate dehydrogenase